jgi:hypothetical protein
VRHSDRRQLLALCCGVVIGKVKEAGTIQPFALEYNFLLHVCSPQLVEWAEKKYPRCRISAVTRSCWFEPSKIVLNATLKISKK